MKRSPTVPDTPARVMIAAVTIMQGSELLIALLIESIHSNILKNVVLKKRLFEFIEPIALVHHDRFFPRIAADLQAYECQARRT